MEILYSDIVKVFKAFCDENRLKILDQLRAREKCACELLDYLCVTQSTLSHHMKLLCDADVVKARKDGKWIYYSINIDGVERAKKMLDHQLNINKDIDKFNYK